MGILRSVLLAAGASALIGLAVVPAPAAASCVYDPGGYRGASYYTTNSGGNDPDVHQNYGCSGFWMSRGNLGPSYQNWRGWLYGGGGWHVGTWHYDGTSGQGVLLVDPVAATTPEHAQSSSGWRNQEYH